MRLHKRAATCEPSNSITSTAAFSSGVILYSFRISETFLRPFMPYGTIQSPLFQRRSAWSEPNLSASAIKYPSGCFSVSTVSLGTNSRTSLLSTAPPQRIFNRSLPTAKGPNRLPAVCFPERNNRTRESYSAFPVPLPSRIRQSTYSQCFTPSNPRILISPPGSSTASLAPRK